MDKEIIISPTMFSAPKVMMVQHGMTLRQMIDQMYFSSNIPPACRTYDLVIEIDGEPVDRDRWDIIPGVKSHVLINVPIHGGDGGKNPLRTILSIVVVVVAALVTFWAGGAGGWGTAGALGLTGASATAYGAAVGAVVGSAGMLLVNAIAPIRPAQLSAGSNSKYSDSPTYSLTGARNQATPFGPIPVVLGKHKMFPPYGAAPYTEILGNDEYLRMLFVWGYGRLKIENIKIGETLLSSDGNTVDGQFDGVEIETVEGRAGDPDLTLIPNIVYQDQIGVELINSDGRLVRTARAGVDELSVDYVFPQGLLQIDSNGNRSFCEVMVLVEYREVGTAEWTKILTENIVSTSLLCMNINFISDGTYSIYVSKKGVFSWSYGITEKADNYRITEVEGHYDDITGFHIDSVIDLHPIGTTGLDASADGNNIQIEAGTVYGYEYTGDIIDNNSSALRYGYRWTVDRTKQYEVGLTRVTADAIDDKVLDKVYWSVLRGFRNDHPVTFPYPLAMTAVRIKASGQLQGVIDNLSAIVTSYAPVWDGEKWAGEEPTQSPAALYRLVLTHPANAKRRILPN